MADSLYPVFDVPVAIVEDSTNEDVYPPSASFDFANGDFKRDGSGRTLIADGYEAYKNWVYKVLNTQLNACEAYPDMGIDYDAALANGQRSVVQAELERAITEGLLQHPKTQRVRDFAFTWQADSLYASFNVQGANTQAFNVNMQII